MSATSSSAINGMIMLCLGCSIITSCMPNPVMVENTPSELLSHFASGLNAGNLLYAERTFHEAPFARRNVSSGDMASFPGQNGQSLLYSGRAIFSFAFFAKSIGRFALSVAITTHSLEIILYLNSD